MLFDDGVAVTSDGVITAFRDRSDKEIRDIAVSRLENGTWTPGTTRVHETTGRSMPVR